MDPFSLYFGMFCWGLYPYLFFKAMWTHVYENRKKVLPRCCQREDPPVQFILTPKAVDSESVRHEKQMWKLYTRKMYTEKI